MRKLNVGLDHLHGRVRPIFRVFCVVLDHAVAQRVAGKEGHHLVVDARKHELLQAVVVEVDEVHLARLKAGRALERERRVVAALARDDFAVCRRRVGEGADVSAPRRDVDAGDNRLVRAVDHQKVLDAVSGHVGNHLDVVDRAGLLDASATVWDRADGDAVTRLAVPVGEALLVIGGKWIGEQNVGALVARAHNQVRVAVTVDILQDDLFHVALLEAVGVARLVKSAGCRVLERDEGHAAVVVAKGDELEAVGGVAVGVLDGNGGRARAVRMADRVANCCQLLLIGSDGVRKVGRRAGAKEDGILLLAVAEDNVEVAVAVDVCDGDSERVLLLGARELNRRLEAVVAVAQEQLRLLLGRRGEHEVEVAVVVHVRHNGLVDVVKGVEAEADLVLGKVGVARRRARAALHRLAGLPLLLRHDVLELAAI